MTPPLQTTVPVEFIHFAEELADASRALIRSRFRQRIEIVTKDDNSPVTAADLEVERMLRERINTRFPGHGIVGEEYPATLRDAECVWVLDPIDGTRAFIAGRPVFGTLITLTIGRVPVLGVIDIPIMRERWVGAAGHPTLLNGAVATARRCPSTREAILLACSPEYLDGDAAEPFARLAGAVRFAVYDTGTQGYGLIASGHADIMTAARYYSIVDYLAAVPVIEGAGGLIRDWQGNPLTIDSRDRFVAVGDPSMLSPVLDILGNSQMRGQTHDKAV